MHSISTMYTDPDSALRDSLIEVVITDVTSLLSPPNIVLTMDRSCNILQQHSLSVRHIVLLWYVTYLWPVLGKSAQTRHPSYFTFMYLQILWCLKIKSSKYGSGSSSELWDMIQIIHNFHDYYCLLISRKMRPKALLGRPLVFPYTIACSATLISHVDFGEEGECEFAWSLVAFCGASGMRRVARTGG
jgi:hypothetical protein